MNLLRIVGGWACIAIALAVIATLALGGFGGAGHAVSGRSIALMAHLPGVVFGLALLCVGIWLLKKNKTSP